MNEARDPLYRRHRFPAEVISHAVWLYFRFPLSLRMVEEMLAARGIDVSYESHPRPSRQPLPLFPQQALSQSIPRHSRPSLFNLDRDRRGAARRMTKLTQ